MILELVSGPFLRFTFFISKNLKPRKTASLLKKKA